jgi:uncharacterized protein (DUF302 family)
MAILQFTVDRFSVVSSRSFAEVLSALEAAIGHPEMLEFGKKMVATKSWKELEQLVRASIGPSGFMEFTRFNLGLVIAREKGPSAPKIVRLVVGNPLIMKQMAEHVPDTASYAPVNILIDEREDGVHLSYDLMASYLAPYGNLAALKVARELDAKVETLLIAAARSAK